MAHKFGLSVALFAHGWTCETAVSWDQFIDNECRSAVFPIILLYIAGTGVRQLMSRPSGVQ